MAVLSLTGSPVLGQQGTVPENRYRVSTVHIMDTGPPQPDDDGAGQIDEIVFFNGGRGDALAQLQGAEIPKSDGLRRAATDLLRLLDEGADLLAVLLRLQERLLGAQAERPEAEDDPSP